MLPNWQNLIQADGLDGALQRVQQDIRSNPGDVKLRLCLFQLLAVQGQWQRAIGQLQVIAQLDGTLMELAQTYRSAIRAEVHRNDVFAGKLRPLLLGEAAPWLTALLDALQHDAKGESAKAQAARLAALADAPEVAGQTADQSFVWIADGDARLGPVVEAIIHGQYHWLSFEQIVAIHLEAPSDLRDLVWQQARLTLENEGEVFALLPTRYPDISGTDDAIKLARKTEWQELGDDLYLGRGQKMWMTDMGEHALLDLRHLSCDNQTAVAQ